MTSDDIQIIHHNALLTLRCQDRIVQSEYFTAAWDAADNMQRKACHRLLRKLKVDELKIWIANVLFSDLSVQRIRALRRLASNHRVPNYCNLSKEELLEILKSKGITHGKSGRRP